jgi:hypothetical protein
MARKTKPSRREALRAFGRKCEPPDAVVDPNVAIGRRRGLPPAVVARAALELEVDAAWLKYQVCKALTELETLRANGGFVH